MDKQQSDHIEQRIRQAAENFTPPYKEEGWDKMEVLLDKEFNKKRRRGFIWWWFGLFVFLLIGGCFYFLNNGSETNKKGEISQKGNIINSRNKKEVSKNGLPADQEKVTASKATAPATTLLSEKHKEQNRENTSLTDSQKRRDAKKSTGAFKPIVTSKISHGPGPGKQRISNGVSSKIAFSSKETIEKQNSVRLQNGKTPKADETQSLRSQVEQPTGKNNRNDSMQNMLDASSQHQTKQPSDTAVIAADSKKDNLLNTVSPATKATSKSAIQLSTSRIAQPGLYFMATIATDGSNVEKFTLNNRKPVYGVGLGYRFNNRVSIQTGFYAGRKIYSAGPDDYKVAPDSYIGRLKILKIDADCIIYELPLLVRYDVIAGKNFRIYANAGLSSFIMKRENYKYHLTGSMGYVMKDSTYRSNKNFFSSAGFAIGFEQKLFESIYIQAEPYIRMPMSGVGEGKVKLYSAGLQFGIKYQPIKNRKKHL